MMSPSFMSGRDVLKSLMLTTLIVFIPVVREAQRYLHSTRARAAAKANAALKISELPSEIGREIFVHLLSSSQIILEWDPPSWNRARLDMPTQPLDVALSCRKFREESAGIMRTMVCRDGARPSDLAIPYNHLNRIDIVILENDNCIPLDTKWFPALQLIICRTGPRYIAKLSNAKLTSDVLGPASLICRQDTIQSQVVGQLPSWMQNIIADTDNNPDIEIELTLLFDQPFKVQEHSWDTGSDYPAWDIWYTCRYSWRSGHITDICSHF